MGERQERLLQDKVVEAPSKHLSCSSRRYSRMRLGKPQLEAQQSMYKKLGKTCQWRGVRHRKNRRSLERGLEMLVPSKMVWVHKNWWYMGTYRGINTYQLDGILEEKTKRRIAPMWGVGPSCSKIISWQFGNRRTNKCGNPFVQAQRRRNRIEKCSKMCIIGGDGRWTLRFTVIYPDWWPDWNGNVRDLLIFNRFKYCHYLQSAQCVSGLVERLKCKLFYFTCRHVRSGHWMIAEWWHEERINAQTNVYQK